MKSRYSYFDSWISNCISSYHVLKEPGQSLYLVRLTSFWLLFWKMWSLWVDCPWIMSSPINCIILIYWASWAFVLVSFLYWFQLQILFLWPVVPFTSKGSKAIDFLALLKKLRYSSHNLCIMFTLLKCTIQCLF